MTSENDPYGIELYVSVYVCVCLRPSSATLHTIAYDGLSLDLEPADLTKLAGLLAPGILLPFLFLVLRFNPYAHCFLLCCRGSNLKSLIAQQIL